MVNWVLKWGTKSVKQLTILGIFLGSLESLAADLEIISAQQIKTLRSQFLSARVPGLKDLNQNKAWSCELFGVRSRMQADKKENFYQFSGESSLDAVANQGIQVVKQYSRSGQGLVGVNGPLFDVIRVLPSGKLMGEMSVPNQKIKGRPASARAELIPSAADKGRTVLIYTVCG